MAISSGIHVPFIMSDHKYVSILNSVHQVHKILAVKEICESFQIDP
jgi:hypothetical protein